MSDRIATTKKNQLTTPKKGHKEHNREVEGQDFPLPMDAFGPTKKQTRTETFGPDSNRETPKKLTAPPHLERSEDIGSSSMEKEEEIDFSARKVFFLMVKERKVTSPQTR